MYEALGAVLKGVTFEMVFADEQQRLGGSIRYLCLWRELARYRMRGSPRTAGRKDAARVT